MPPAPRAAAAARREGQLAHQDAQRSLRAHAVTLQQDASVSLLRQASGGGDGDVGSSPASPLGTPPSVHDLTQRLMRKVSQANQSRVDAVMRQQAPVGKRKVASSVPSSLKGPVRLTIDVVEEVVDELCVGDEVDVTPSVSPPAMAVAPLQTETSTNALGAFEANAEADELSVEDDAKALAEEAEVLEKIRRRHELRRMTSFHAREGEGASSTSAGVTKSVSPTESMRSWPPPPADAPPLAFPSAPSPLLSVPPSSLRTNSSATHSNSIALQRRASNAFAARVSSVCGADEAEKLRKLNRYDNAKSKTAATFSSTRNTPASS